jgi:hypothetical protein
MKQILILLIIQIAFCFSCFSQAQIKTEEQENIYNETLNRFIVMHDSIYRETVKDIYIDNVNGLTTSFPDSVRHHKIIVLNYFKQGKILEKTKHLNMYRFSPMWLENGLFKIGILSYCQWHNNTSITGGGFMFTYKYNCLEKKLIFVKFEHDEI